MIDYPETEKKKEKKKERQANEIIKSESLLRETAGNYIHLIGDADRKARIMVVVNSIFLTISLTLLTKSLDHMPYIWISATILLICNVLTLFFSLQSVQPDFPVIRGDLSENNMMHYKKCSQYSLDDYSIHIKEMIHDNDKKLDTLIRELYYYGNLLNLKYKFLRYAYRIFAWGLIFALASYLFVLLFIQNSNT
jgi:hypothetical protein